MATKKTASKGKTTTATKAKKSPAKKASTATKNVPVTKATPAKKASAKKAEVQPAPAAASNGEAKKLSAIDAAAQVLAESREAMNTKQMIEAMATGGLWTSPGGKTPSATLYSSIIREIAIKGNDARFVKAERGKFLRKS